MIKKIIILFGLSSFLLSGNIVFAQEGEIDIGKNNEQFFVIFFQNIQEKKFEEAYTNLTSEDFQETVSLENFIQMMKEMKLIDFKSKKWTNIKKVNFLIPVWLIKGTFIDQNNEKHEIQFEIVKNVHDLKLRSITEKITIRQLRKRMPKKKEIPKMVQAEIEKIKSAIASKNYKKFYNAFSSAAKNRIRPLDVKKALMAFKKEKIEINFADYTSIKMKKQYPILNNQGIMVVKGFIKMAEKNIDFAFFFDYEWEWKLGGFTLKISEKSL